MDEPQIVPARSVRPFMTATVSAAKQVKSQEKLADSVKAIFSRLKTISAYEMRLTRDTMRNALALREFLLGSAD